MINDLFLFFLGQTCKGKCGDVLEECSCHATCVSLQNCCADYNQSCFQVTPHSSSMLGGRALRILSLVLHPGGSLFCRFVSTVQVTFDTHHDLNLAYTHHGIISITGPQCGKYCSSHVVFFMIKCICFAVDLVL